MIDIKELEEVVLIETNDFNMPVNNLVQEIIFQDKKMKTKMNKEEIYRFACNVISSLLIQDYITVVKTEYEREDESTYIPTCTMDLTREEMDMFCKNPDKWDEMGVFSETLSYELSITDKGRDFFMNEL